jgi:hypothetical protein
MEIVDDMEEEEMEKAIIMSLQVRREGGNGREEGRERILYGYGRRERGEGREKGERK